MRSAIRVTHTSRDSGTSRSIGINFAVAMPERSIAHRLSVSIWLEIQELRVRILTRQAHKSYLVRRWRLARLPVQVRGSFTSGIEGNRPAAMLLGVACKCVRAFPVGPHRPSFSASLDAFRRVKRVTFSRVAGHG